MKSILLAGSLLLTLSAHAETLHVALEGSDARGKGTVEAPFATITKAAQAAKPGDVVRVAAGVYRQRVVIASNGTTGARIRYEPEPGAEVILDGSALRDDTVTITGNDVDWTGFEVRNSSRSGIVVWGAHEVRVQKNRIHGSRRCGIWVGFSSRGKTFDVLIEGNDVYDNVRDNRRRTRDDGWRQSIGTGLASHVTILNNTVHANFGEGIIVGSSTDCVVRSNRVFDNYSAGIYLTYAQKTRVTGNLVYSSGDRRFYRAGQPADGILLSNEVPNDASTATRANTIVNNVVLNTHWGIAYWRRTPQGMRDTLIAHNTVVGATEYLLRVDADKDNRSNVVENNIFWRGTTRPLADGRVEAGGGTTLRFNSWSAASPQEGVGNITGDPHFVHPGGLTAEDYRLQPDSPCRDAGRPSSATTSDYWGKARDAHPDLGAHEL